MKFLIRTFGCQMNKLDSDLLSGSLIQHGYSPVETETEADVIIFNTCSVRRSAEERVYDNLALLKPLKKQRPDVIIGLAGCMAEREKTAALERIPYLDFICGPNQEQTIPEIIAEIRQQRRTIIRTGEGIRSTNDGGRKTTISNSPSAFVLAMRGCDNFCSYCVVPYARGREVSRPIPEIVSEARALAEQGVTEITLLGQNITAYGKGTPDNLGTLLHAVHKIEELKRIHFVTSHPAYAAVSLFEALRDLPRVSKHLHMPAQSGSDRILKAMNRRYTRADYLRIVEQARALVPDIEFASDFIVGFPGETEAEFRETVKLMDEVQFLNSFIFKYSVRPGTAAAKLPDDVPYKVKQERNKILLETQSQISEKKNQQLIGRTVEVLVAGRSKRNLQNWSGRTPQNHLVHGAAGTDLTGQLVKVKITDATALSLRGTLN